MTTYVSSVLNLKTSQSIIQAIWDLISFLKHKSYHVLKSLQPGLFEFKLSRSRVTYPSFAFHVAKLHFTFTKNEMFFLSMVSIKRMPKLSCHPKCQIAFQLGKGYQKN